jgi:hypothetical protein
MTKITTVNTDEIASRYLAVWREPDAEARRAAIAGLWAPDAVEYVEGIQFRGHAELEKRVAEAHHQFVVDRGFSITPAGDITRHDDVIIGGVQFVTLDDEVVWSARIFLIVGEDGLIREDYQLTVQQLAQ